MAQLESLADAPGKAREYETIFILTPDTPNDGIAKINDRVKGIVDSLGGNVLKVDNWGKRKLAYEVGKQLKGIYLYWQYLGTTGLVEELERNLRMLDPVIRYMTVKLDADVDPNVRPSEMDDEAYARAAETAADEEDLIMGHAAIDGDGDGDGDRDRDGDDDEVSASGDDDDSNVSDDDDSDDDDSDGDSDSDDVDEDEE
jgi:small subunit ribosomal protein S6